MLKLTRFGSHMLGAEALALTGSQAALGALPTVASFRWLGASAPLAKGHSKWQNIQATKGKRDDERSRRIAYYLHQLQTVIRDGTDPKSNKRLADMERDYLKESLPLDTLHRAIQRLKDKPDVTLTYQLLGPGGSQFIVQMEAETKSKMQNTLTKLLKKMPAFKLTDELIGKEFEEKGIIVVESTKKDGTSLSLEQVEEIGIELECEEVRCAGSDESGEKFELVCAPMDLYRIEKRMNEMQFEILSAYSEMVPTGDRVQLDGVDAAAVEAFYMAVQDFESIQEITDNLVEEDNKEGGKAAVASK